MKLLLSTLLVVLIVSLTVSGRKDSFRRSKILLRTINPNRFTKVTAAPSKLGRKIGVKTFFNNKLIEKIKSTLNITRPKYQKSIKYPVCKRSFSKEENDTVNTLADVLKMKSGTIQCSKTRDRSISSDLEYHSRVRRTAEETAVLTELGLSASGGASATQVMCTTASDLSCGTLNMCYSCQYNIELPETYYPRNHVHFTCGNNGDISCLMGEGACVQNLREQWILYDSQNLGYSQMHNWSQASFTFNTGCSCRVVENGLFSYFV